ncbi:membrane protein insertase YidC [Priestia koreensis]|uniref:Membrane insertase YidC/Oxa/ALB C-terminal domain-containing protein n=1 Tax=Priestia koreensis TaxID=284581 RepID=A0A0M0L6C2_9BACI|nr:membrane protein insertase YidC [Priestia koreensis]KOO46223.1 hypothetical protein AMD01_10195 [Priestia koreensis]
MFTNRKILLIMFASLLLLTGCAPVSISGNSNGGLWSEHIIYPITLLIIYMGNAWFHHSIGFSIMMFTLGVRTLLSPLNVVQYKSQLNTKNIQPKVQELKEKYTRTDKDSQQNYQKELAELMKENGANPLLGCLPLLVQLPIFSIVYYAIRGVDEIGSSSFLWLNLGHADPYFVFPLLAAGLTFVQTKMMQHGQNGSSMPARRLTQFLSPAMILIFGSFSPAGLVLYWITGNLFMIVQSMILKKWFGKHALTAA